MATTSIEASGAKNAAVPFDRKLWQKGCDEKLTGDELEALQANLKAHPVMYRKVGNIQGMLRKELYKTFQNQSSVVESVTLNVDELRRNLVSPTDSGLEKLLIDAIATCWLDASIQGMRTAMATQRNLCDEADYWERRQHGAHLRLLKTIEMLARVRKLGVPSVQINVAEKQINVAG